MQSLIAVVSCFKLCLISDENYKNKSQNIECSKTCSILVGDTVNCCLFNFSTQQFLALELNKIHVMCFKVSLNLVNCYTFSDLNI